MQSPAVLDAELQKKAMLLLPGVLSPPLEYVLTGRLEVVPSMYITILFRGHGAIWRGLILEEEITGGSGINSCRNLIRILFMKK